MAKQKNFSRGPNLAYYEVGILYGKTAVLRHRPSYSRGRKCQGTIVIPFRARGNGGLKPTAPGRPLCESCGLWLGRKAWRQILRKVKEGKLEPGLTLIDSSDKSIFPSAKDSRCEAQVYWEVHEEDREVATTTTADAPPQPVLQFSGEDVEIPTPAEAVRDMQPWARAILGKEQKRTGNKLSPQKGFFSESLYSGPAGFIEPKTQAAPKTAAQWDVATDLLKRMSDRWASDAPQQEVTADSNGVEEWRKQDCTPTCPVCKKVDRDEKKKKKEALDQ